MPRVIVLLMTGNGLGNDLDADIKSSLCVTGRRLAAFLAEVSELTCGSTSHPVILALDSSIQSEASFQPWWVLIEPKDDAVLGDTG
jgi:hypothetical protein